MADILFPLQTDARLRTANAGFERHVADMLEQVLFTNPGERVMRPGFGAGLAQLVFAPGGDELAIATRFLVEGAIQQWLGDLIELEDVEADFADGRLTLTVVYASRRTAERFSATFERAA